MATVFTHFICAGALATAGPRSVSRIRLGLVLGTLAVIPDLDVIGFHFGIAYGDSLGHRGFTHSIVFALLLAGLGVKLAHPKIVVFDRVWWHLAGLMFLAIVSHGVLDAFTDAGLGVGFLIPFDDTRYFAPWRPLATSPLSVAAFLDGPALRILANEFVWVLGPLFIVLLVARTLRRIR